MHIIHLVKDIRELCKRWQDRRKLIGLVPTMGALHDGHMALIDKAQEENDIVIATIFVNPLQFGRGEDFETYPRYIDSDIERLKKQNIDAVFIPDTSEIYPKDFSTSVNVTGITEGLCGKSRPGHFKGVATIIVKLFNIIKPNNAYFGEKDYQQLLVIKRLASDLNYDISIKGIPTIREKDGLAMSSRNMYLTQSERIIAININKALLRAKEMVKMGNRDARKILEEISNLLTKDGKITMDYLTICDCNTLKEMEYINDRALLAVAVKIGKTRLIDNCMLEG